MSNKRISELTAKSAILESSDLLEVSDYNGSTYDSKKITGGQLRGAEIVTKTSNYTLALGDEGKTIIMNNASARYITIPAYSSVAFVTGTRFVFYTINGDLTILESELAPGSIYSLGGNMKLSGTYGRAEIIMIGADEWILSGDLTT